MGGAALKGSGGAAAIGGIIGALVALKMNTSVHSAGDYRYGTYVPASDTINIGLLQDQHLAFLAAGFVFMAGIVLFSAGAIIEAMAFASPGASHSASGTDSAIDPEASDVRPAISSVPLADAKKDETALLVVGSFGALVLLVFAIFALSGSNSTGSSVAAAQIEANADALADNMEVQADNMDAIADTTSAAAIPAPTLTPVPEATSVPQIEGQEEPDENGEIGRNTWEGE